MAIKRFGNNKYEWLTADTPPTNVPAGSRGRNTQLGLDYTFNGTYWDLDEVSTTEIDDLAVTTGKLATSLTGISAKIPDGEITWAKVSKSGATATIRETEVNQLKQLLRDVGLMA